MGEAFLKIIPAVSAMYVNGSVDSPHSGQDVHIIILQSIYIIRE